MNICFLYFVSFKFSIRNKKIWSEIASDYIYYRLTDGSIWFGRFHEISCIGRILWTCIGLLLCTCSTPGFGGFVLIWYILHYRVSHRNSATNCISYLLWISIVIPNFKSHNIIMSARVYFLKRVKDCKDVSIMSLQDEQWRRTSLLCLYTEIFLFYKVQPYAVKT